VASVSAVLKISSLLPPRSLCGVSAQKSDVCRGTSLKYHPPRIRLGPLVTRLTWPLSDIHCNGAALGDFKYLGALN
jgi:hypothetical protein